MKCPNCGGDVSVYDTHCPYCGSENPEGIAYQEELRRRTEQNKYLKQEAAHRLQIPRIHMNLNIAIGILFLALILTASLSFVTYSIQEGSLFHFAPKDAAEQMQRFYENGEYGKLYAFIHEYNLSDSEKVLPEYMQMCLYHNDYQNFQEHAMLCMELLEQGELPDDYKLTSVLGDAYELFSGYIYAYPDTCPKNQEALDEYRTQAKIFLMGAFHMTEEDLAIMRLEEHYLDSKTEDQLVKLAKQRIAEVIYFHETGD